eukprot:TRINITY_DN8845_c0_g1_i1.p1 TRINITY_DN8845_c0_g1~~TRINITY_DN8845_c0_g1_i1.p1  ORF type:complete len:606 (-),score=114.25 TRINITY_DN8845_c0_g1_i1:1566-3305(-)
MDVVGSRGIVRLLRSSDAEVLSGWGGYIGMKDESFLSSFEGVVDQVVGVLRSEGENANIKVIFSGAGTSGRLSFFCARSLNQTISSGQYPSLKGKVTFSYDMAGGDLALIKSQERSEDSVVEPVETLKKLSVDENGTAYSHIVYVGITCGLSAPHVGSQLDYLVTGQLGVPYTAVLIGFNPADQARTNTIEGWTKSMHDVVTALLNSSKSNPSSPATSPSSSYHALLNPILGPEPLTGSSRMKGGTATKLLLEAIFCCVFEKAEGLSSPSLFDILLKFEEVRHFTYAPVEQIAAVMEKMADSLRNGGHIYYIGEGAASILSLIDASECPPTFGAKFTDIKGYVIGGWKTMQNVDGDISGESEWYRISEDHFAVDIAPSLTEHDIVVGLTVADVAADALTSFLQTHSSSKAKVALLSWGDIPSSLIDVIGESPTVTISLPSPSLGRIVHSLTEMSIKWTLNCLSTGAHVLAGKVYQNLMIDLCLSNYKLYFRGISIVQELVNVSEEVATTCVLCAIYDVDTPNDAIRGAPISEHYLKAVEGTKVMPIAILLAAGISNIAKAKELLASQPVLSLAIKSVTK